VFLLSYHPQLAVVTWNSQSGNSRGRESLEFPLEFPAQKRPFSGNSLEFPYRGGSSAYRGGSTAYRGGFGFVSYQKILQYLCLGSSFAAVVVDDTAIRASTALEERNNEATARKVPLQSPILPIAEFLAS